MKNYISQNGSNAWYEGKEKTGIRVLNFDRWRKWQIHFQSHDAIGGVAFAFCVRPRPSSRHAFSYYYRIQIGDSRPRFVADLFRRGSREGVSRKSVTVPCADRFRHLLRGSNHDRVIIFLDFDWNTWRDRRSRTLLSLSSMIFFRFGIYWRFEVWSDFWLILEWWIWLVFLDTMFILKLVFCCCCCYCNLKWNN